MIIIFLFVVQSLTALLSRVDFLVRAQAAHSVQLSESSLVTQFSRNPDDASSECWYSQHIPSRLPWQKKYIYSKVKPFT